MRSELPIPERLGAPERPHLTSGTIVAASDGRDDSGGALFLARALADRLATGFEVVSVVEPTNTIIPPIQPALQALHHGVTRVQDRRDRLRALCGCSLAGRPRCPIRILLGDVPSSIAAAAEGHGAQLVVTGRVPHGPIERAMRRETALATARCGRTPVLAVPPTVRELPRTVVVAVGQGRAAARLAPIARALFAESVAVHLVCVKRDTSARWESDARLEDDAREHAAERAFARALASWALPADVPVNTHIVTGTVSGALTSFARSVGADLIVIGSTGAASTPRVELRDAATRLFHAVSCAVLLVPVAQSAAGEDEGPTAVSLAIRDWPSLLTNFSKRNCGRAASLSVEEQGHEARSVVRSWTLAGVACARVPRVIEIMLADPTDPTRHLSHVITAPTVSAMHVATLGCDDALLVRYPGGQMVLTLA